MLGVICFARMNFVQIKSSEGKSENSALQCDVAKCGLIVLWLAENFQSIKKLWEPKTRFRELSNNVLENEKSYNAEFSLTYH